MTHTDSYMKVRFFRPLVGGIEKGGQEQKVLGTLKNEEDIWRHTRRDRREKPTSPMPQFACLSIKDPPVIGAQACVLGLSGGGELPHQG